MSPVVRTDWGYVGRSAAVAVVCLVGVSVFVVWGSQDGEPSPTFGVVLLVSVLAAWVLIFWFVMWPYFFVYHCPTCKRRLPRTTPGLAVRYHCERCNVVWDLFFQPRGD